MTTPQGTTERFIEKFGGENEHFINSNNVQDILSFIESETSLSYQRGQDDENKRCYDIALVARCGECGGAVEYGRVATCRGCYGSVRPANSEVARSLLKAKESNHLIPHYKIPKGGGAEGAPKRKGWGAEGRESNQTEK